MFNIYTIYDKKTQSYDPPFAAATHGAAERIVDKIVNGEGNQVAEYAEDFSLWHVGKWNEDTGETDAHKPVHLADLVAFKKKAVKNQ
ncbi:MAG: nonstructural protein [Microviridae sp.]|nr:MAG: nonstructural protein [Microviridae sp.]